VEDAVEATKTAVRDGIVPGGEIALLNISQTLNGTDSPTVIMRNALESPFKKLLENANLDSGEYKQILKSEPKGRGVDVTTGKLVDMIKQGIIDPTGVLVSAVYNACSVAIACITSEAVIPFDRNGSR